MKRTIAILQHERQRTIPRDYMIAHLARFWREDGLEVVSLFGVKEYVPADLLFMHVDLSVVPDEYLRFAERYPAVVNGRVGDIRKSTYSSLLVRRSDPYDGPVIVKSNYNYAGLPELSVGFRLDEIHDRGLPFRSPNDYRVYERLALVPPAFFDDSRLVVEKFQPELEAGFYHVRVMVFLGSRTLCTRLASRHPVVNGTSLDHMEVTEPHPEIVALKQARGFQYGKFDYVIHQGCAILLDTNKTIGGPPPTSDPVILASRRRCAEGLYEFLPR